MRNVIKAIVLLYISVLPVFAQRDVAGSSDHPLITRYPGSSIGYYEQQQYEDIQSIQAIVSQKNQQ